MPSTFLYSLLTVVFSFIIVNFYSFIQEKRKIKTNAKKEKHYACFWLKKILEGLEKQTTNVQDFNLIVKDCNVRQKNYYNKIHTPYSKLLEMSSPNLFAVFVTNARGDTTEKEKRYSTFINAIEFLKIKEESILKHLESFQQRTNYRMTKLHEYFLALEESRIHIIQEQFKTEGRDEFTEGLINLYNENVSKTSSLQDIWINFIEPLNTFCHATFAEFQKDERIPPMMNLLYKFRGLYEYFEIDKVDLSKELISYDQILNDYRFKLKEIENHYYSVQLKCLFLLT